MIVETCPRLLVTRVPMLGGIGNRAPIPLTWGQCLRVSAFYPRPPAPFAATDTGEFYVTIATRSGLLLHDREFVDYCRACLADGRVLECPRAASPRPSCVADCHTDEDQHDREQLAHRGQRVNLAETYRRDRRNGPIQRVDKSEPKNYAARSPGDDHQPNR